MDLFDPVGQAPTPPPTSTAVKLANNFGLNSPSTSSVVRHRKPTFSDEDIRCIIDACRIHKELVLSKFNDVETNRRKNILWTSITDMINSRNSLIKRTVVEVRKKWKDLLFRSRRDFAAGELEQNIGAGNIIYYSQLIRKFIIDEAYNNNNNNGSNNNYNNACNSPEEGVILQPVVIATIGGNNASYGPKGTEDQSEKPIQQHEEEQPLPLSLPRPTPPTTSVTTTSEQPNSITATAPPSVELRDEEDSQDNKKSQDESSPLDSISRDQSIGELKNLHERLLQLKCYMLELEIKWIRSDTDRINLEKEKLRLEIQKLELSLRAKMKGPQNSNDGGGADDDDEDVQ